MTKTFQKVALVAAASFALWSCRDDASSSSTQESAKPTEETYAIANLTNNVIIQTYANLNDKVKDLKSKVDAITVGDDAALSAARDAWKAAREPWESSEGFLLGPVENKKVDPHIDTWPVDVNAMNDIITSNTAITKETIAHNDESRGFHLIEYLLWGSDGNKAASAFSARELELLRAATDDLLENTQLLYNSWAVSDPDNDGQPYKNLLLTAYQGNKKYKSDAAVFQDLIGTMIDICNEVGTSKIEDPLNGDNQTAAPEKEESRFSHNSKIDFANNIRSIQNLYLGGIGTHGLGFSTIVQLKYASLSDAEKKKYPDLDANTRKAIQDAIDGINNIEGDFSDAIKNDNPTGRASVASAQDKVKALKAFIESQLQPFVRDHF